MPGTGTVCLNAGGRSFADTLSSICHLPSSDNVWRPAALACETNPKPTNPAIVTPNTQRNGTSRALMPP
jgi:hypothetical protein